tara:strand:- start:238 stop:963 length:726 start_codon:yes stop_codon:yes gene_type:complete
MFTGCGSSEEKQIEDATEEKQIEDSTQGASSKQSKETIRITALQDGDCFNGLSADLATEYYDVEVVPCSDPWMYKVLNSFKVDENGTYPGEYYFYEQFDTHCDRRATLFLFPYPESWELGDRTINCLSESGQITKEESTTQTEPKQIAPQQEEGQLELVEWDWGTDSYWKTLHGIVANKSEYTQTFVCITFAVYDQEGFKVEDAYACVDSLRPGEQWKFEALVTEDTAYNAEPIELIGYPE